MIHFQALKLPTFGLDKCPVQQIHNDCANILSKSNVYGQVGHGTLDNIHWQTVDLSKK